MTARPFLPRLVAPLLLAALFAPALAPGSQAWLPSGDEVPCQSPLRCPDLVVDAERLGIHNIVERTFSASHCAVQEGMVGEGTHRLLRFTFTSPNVGMGPLEVGAPAAHPEWFEWADCHGHFHFREYADYRLWTPEAYDRWREARDRLPILTPAEQFALDPSLAEGLLAGEKAGFCVIDMVGGYASRYFITTSSERVYRSCSSNQGIALGWADEYHYALDGQWIVIDDVAPGRYVLEAEVNAERLFSEIDHANNAAAVEVFL